MTESALRDGKALIRRVRHSNAARNFGWLLADRGLRLIVGIGVGSWVARYLGTAEFGALNYSLALVTIASAVAPLGMDMLAVREVIRRPAEAGRWIGTIIGFRFAGALVLVLAVAAALNVMRPGAKGLMLLLVILGVGVLAQSLESGEVWFQSRVEMRRLVIPRLLVFLLFSALKVAMILRGRSVFWFAALTAGEQLACGAATWVLVRRALRSSQALSFSWTKGIELLTESWPLALSSIAVIVYLKAGQIMIGNLLGNEGVGIYSSAIRVPEVFFFIPTVLASSMLPGLVAAQDEGGSSGHAAALRFMRLNALISIGLAAPLAALSPWVVGILYGKAFAEAGSVMSIYSAALVFVFLGVARGQFLLNDRRTLPSFWFSISGMALSLGLNYWLIPRYGVNGAAVAAVTTFAVAGCLSSFVARSTRPLGWLQLRAIATPWQGLRALGGG